MKVTYHQNINGNCMIISEMKETNEDDYSLKMIQRNKIPGLLDASYESMNGESRIFYDIASKQSFHKIFESGRVNRQHMKNLIASLEYCVKQMQEYLLDSEKIMLLPEFIYTDMDAEKFYFCFNPFYESRMQDDLRNFFDQIISFIDYEDTELVKNIYELHMMAQKGMLNIQDMKLRFQTEQEADAISLHCIFSEISDSDMELSPEMENEEEERSELLENIDFVNPENRENQNFFKKFKIYREGRNLKDIIEDIDEGTFLKKIKMAVPEKERRAKKQAAETKRQEMSKRCLIRTGNDIEEIIPLTSYPFSVGKVRNKAGCVLKSPAVSRLHARIYESDGNYQLEDLGSTNGTYINGTKVPAYTKQRLSRGDLICFADQEYLFR